ncbi:uncharacterized protein LOC133806866 [Humulus lupulus]|uniref:uncharacterized protein LOC133806866 n=1 Tax=Humulus lupulus TaxID=3486 RepID=UPI002B40F84F|nr:uncharacterized protein LOC133806866 [Humulus lupulus]
MALQEDMRKQAEELRELRQLRQQQAQPAPLIKDIQQHIALIVAIPGPVNNSELLYEWFRKQHPPVFKGSTNPWKVDQWMSMMGSILDFILVEGNDRVACTTLMLRDDARIWWEVISQTGDVTTMTWAEFQQAFNDKYYNASIRASTVDEFATLTQGNMTVTEYTLMFDRLAMFAVELVPTNATRVDWFVQGLKPMITRDVEIVSVGGNSTYAQVLERALIAERMENKIWMKGVAKRKARKNAAKGHNSNDQKRKGSDLAGQSSQDKRAKDIGEKIAFRSGSTEFIRVAGEVDDCGCAGESGDIVEATTSSL